MRPLAGVRALLSLHRSVTSQQSIRLCAVQITSNYFPRSLCSVAPKSNESKTYVNPENETLLENLNLMGVDVKMARQRQPGVFRKLFTNEHGLAQFLQTKGACRTVIAGIISRYPRSITRSIEHLEQRWKLWRTIFQSDAEIVSILDRSPESFFRSSDNGNLEKNIEYLSSLGLNTKVLHRMLTTAPRTFSNSLELNKQRVEFLEDICADLGGKNPELFVRTVMAKNVYILIRSTKRVKTNIDNLKASLKLSDSDLLALLHGPAADILDLSNEYLKKNLSNLEKKMISFGCRKSDTKKFVISYPLALYSSSETLSAKLDCLLKEGITMKQILEKPKILDYSIQTITQRLEELQRIGYDFQVNGIAIMDLSQKRFSAKMERLTASAED